MDQFRSDCPFSSMGEMPEFGLLGSGAFSNPNGQGTLYNRIVYPPKPAEVTLRVEWNVTFDDAVSDPEEWGTMVSQAMNNYTEEDDPV